MKTSNKGYLFYIAFVLLVMAVPLLIVSATVNIFICSTDLYTGGFAKYRSSEVTGISDAQLKEVARGMADYLGGKTGSPQVEVKIKGINRPVYNQKELIHLADVRKITDMFKTLGVVSLVLSLAAGLYLFFRSGPVQLFKGLQTGAIVTVALLGSAMLWALIDFDSIFYLFHILSFSNDLWLLDPAKDYLIMMFPSGFFFDAAVLMVGTIIAAAVAVWLAAYVLKKVRAPVEK